MFSYKLFKDYLPLKNYASFSITHTFKVEIDANISSTNKSKSTGPKSKTLKTLKLTQNEISQHLADVLNLSFQTGLFPDF